MARAQEAEAQCCRTRELQAAAVAYRHGQGSKGALLLFLGEAGGHGKGANTAIQVAVGQVQGELSQGQLVAVCEVEACGPHLIKTGGRVRLATRGRKPRPPALPKPQRPN